MNMEVSLYLRQRPTDGPEHLQAQQEFFCRALERRQSPLGVDLAASPHVPVQEALETLRDLPVHCRIRKQACKEKRLVLAPEKTCTSTKVRL